MSRFQGKLPILLSAALVILILQFSYHKLSLWPKEMVIPAAALIALYLLWIVIESKVAVKEIDKNPTRWDKGTLELYAAGRAFTIYSALGLPTLWREAGVAMYLGIAFFVAGVSFRLIAIRTLGKFYSHRIRKANDHQIVSNGPYRVLRHPAYTGMLVAHFGFVLFFFNWISLAIFACFFLPAVVLRILFEEKMLFELPGYSDFAAKRRRLVPYLW